MLHAKTIYIVLRKLKAHYHHIGESISSDRVVNDDLKTSVFIIGSKLTAFCIHIKR